MIQKYFLSILLSFLVVFLTVSQTEEPPNKAFDSVYFHVATNLSGQDINRAFTVADSLHQSSSSALQRVKTLMLISTLYMQTGNSEQAIIEALKAEIIANNNKLYEWQARISGFLSTQYRGIGLYERGKTYLDKGLKASTHFTDQNHKNLYMKMVYQERTYYHLVSEEYDKAVESTSKAEEYLQKIPDNPQVTYFKATNKLLWGRVYLKKKQYELSIENNQKALELLVGISDENALVNGFIYNGLGSAYLALEDYSQAKYYLDKADLIANSSESANLRLEVYEALSDYYFKTDDPENYLLYQQKYFETQKTYDANKKKTIDNIISSLEQYNKNLSYRSDLLKVALAVLLGLILTLIFFYRQQKKRDLQRFEKLIEKLKQDKHQKTSVNQQIIQTTDLKKDKTPKKSVNISEKKEKEIIEGLQEFEQNKGFLDRNISLSILAGTLNTNTIYLSHILNNVSGKDFNTYINELRVYYIVEKLREDKEYRQYKISYLAEECGFSSHSKFSSIFKSVTQLSPSTFIERLNKLKVK